MEFRNLTPFDVMCFSALDKQDVEHPVIVMKVGYRLEPIAERPGHLSAQVIDDEPLALCLADHYFGEEGRSSVKEESDLAPFKPRCDVIINGHAHAPNGTLTRDWVAGIRLSEPAAPLKITVEQPKPWKAGEPLTQQQLYPGRYKRDVVGKPFTENRITALRHDVRIAEVEGDDVRLQPGLSFTLTGHPRDDLNTHWRVNTVTHRGIQFTSLQEEAAGVEQGTRYEQTAVLVPGRTEWRPAPLSKPRVDGPHMATVVGPKGEEIYCDEWGRVKVSFPWDRESQNDEFSSCWVRVSQGWAGGSWGDGSAKRCTSQAKPSRYTGRCFTGRDCACCRKCRAGCPACMSIRARTAMSQNFCCCLATMNDFSSTR